MQQSTLKLLVYGTAPSNERDTTECKACCSSKCGCTGNAINLGKKNNEFGHGADMVSDFETTQLIETLWCVMSK
jgi:hypothetical protein